MTRFPDENGESEEGGIINYSNENGGVEITDYGNGVLRIIPTRYSDDQYQNEAEQLAAALAWWIGQTHARVKTVASVTDIELGSSLIVVTENNEE